MKCHIRMTFADVPQIHPSPRSIEVKKGYLTLPPDYIATNPSFTLHIPLVVRVVAPHPFVNQDTISLVRGPIVYCVEDFDNTWVTDHFKTLQLDPNATITDKLVTDPVTSEEYVALTVHRGASVLPQDKLKAEPTIAWRDLRRIADTSNMVEELHLVPYYFRSNRGGKGQSRTGIRRWIR